MNQSSWSGTPSKARSVSRRTRSSSIGSAGSTGWLLALFGFLQLRHEFLCLLHVEHRERRSAMRAGGACAEIDRTAAVGAIHRTHVLPQLGDLLRRQRPDEVLLAQEVEEADQTPVPVRAIQILEPCRALHVLRASQAALAAWTLGELGVGVLGLVSFSPMMRNSDSVDPGVSATLSRGSNQNDWQA